MSELLWIAVPGGALAGGEARLRALVVPRLSGGAPDGDLQSYGLADWPALLAHATLAVQIAAEANDAPVPLANAVRLDGEHVKPGLWPKLFPPGLAVRPFQQPAAYATPHVERSTAHRDAIVGIYQPSAVATGDPGEIERRLLAADLGASPQHGASRRRQPSDGAARGLHFHQITSLLREHPDVLRALGLLVEFGLPSPSALGAAGLVRVHCELGDPGVPSLKPVSRWTRYVVERGRFLPAPAAGSDIKGGMVDLGRPMWQFATFDVAGGIDRVRDAARNVGAAAARRSPATAAPSTATLPALRSAGLSLLRQHRAELYGQRVAAARALGRELLADDLVLGYRIDVRTSDTPWASLCRRTAEYHTADGEPIVAPLHEEEGQVKAHGATVVYDPQDGTRADRPQLLADEVVARWDGWSLTCPRRLGFAAGRRRPEGERRVEVMQWTFKPVGLPDLRFGDSYRMRVRIADAAGGGLELGDPQLTECESQEVFYARHDPIPPPELAPAQGPLVPQENGRIDPAVFGPGGSLEQLVIRSDPATGESVAAFAAQFPDNARRLLMPPYASFALAEAHRMFDDQPDDKCAELLRRATSAPTFDADGHYSWLPDPAAEGVSVYIRPEPASPAPGTTKKEAWSVPSGEWPDFGAKRLVLEAPGTPQDPTLDWTAEGRVALVRLAPAQQVVLELTSSVVHDDLDKFEMQNWLKSRPGASDDTDDHVFDVVREGRHPMVSPARVIRLVHAVKTPLRPPLGNLAAQRESGQTVAVIGDPNNPRLNVDPLSTAQIELSAKWDERTDNLVTPVPPTPVQIAALKVDAVAIPPLRHELGDTRHRTITYTVTALSRFRQFFASAPDAEFQAVPLTASVSVPSSARPPMPVVLSATPAFKWTNSEVTLPWDRLERSRLGGRVRIELARPWHISGDDECLAVLVAPTGGVPHSARRYLTSIRRDPIWATPTPPADAVAGMFAGFARSPARVVLAETEDEVLAVPFAARFSETAAAGAGRWFADLEIPGAIAASYCPFVRLALARYQPESLPPLHLSGVVWAEPVQLLPDRKLSLQRSAAGVDVTLTGLAAAGANRVVAVIERLPDAAPPERVDVTSAGGAGLAAFGWQRVPEASAEGTLNAPLPPLPVPPGDEPLRLVVREVEQFAGGATASEPADELGERTVFADVVRLR